jgi:hypothetical protein
MKVVVGLLFVFLCLGIFLRSYDKKARFLMLGIISLAVLYATFSSAN